MISIHVMGGLGNQLFQIFSALSYIIDHAVKIIIPYNSSADSCVFRKTYWGKGDFLDSLSIFTNIYTKNMDNNTLAHFQKYKEPSFSYSPIPQFCENTMLVGYFQSYKYFEKNKNNLFSLLKLSKKKKHVLEKYEKYKYFQNIDTIENISMHFRLGDYKYLQDYHPIMSFDYYKNALELILSGPGSTASDPPQCYQVLYFCEKEDNDFIETWIVQFEKIFSGRIVKFVKVVDSIVDWEQMLIMSCCKYNIIANSTFSWWGAYFNTLECKKVYYPSAWFGHKIEHSMVDFFPEDWIEVPIQ